MSLLAVESLSLRFGPKILLDEADLAVEPRERVGVVGPNGAGKSTLLKVLAGLHPPDGGLVHRARGARVGYLAQEHGEVADETLVASLLRSAPGREALDASIRDAEVELASTDDADAQMAAAERLADLHEQATDMDRLFGRHQAERILVGLGFVESDFERPLHAFSGGWRMRAELARLLYERNDVLILDEPTNHLDVPSIEWLSDFLDRSKQTLILTCHDRAFLNRHVQRVASLEVEGLRTFKGNYDQYLAHREQDLAFQEARLAKYEKKKKDLEAFVERFKAKASKARQAQSKNKLIEKLNDELVEVPKRRPVIHFRFPSAKRAGDHVLTLKDLVFGYSEHPLFDGLNGQIRRGDRVALLGRNGAGKSTLLKLMAGDLKPWSGQVQWGAHVEPRYFAQHHADTLTGQGSILDAVSGANPDASQTEVRNICGAFLFQGTEVDKSVDVLSGGERSRVALARILIRPGNLLLLDEPTNHLDTESADALTESLATYDGTVVFVSHSLAFIRRLATRIWDVRPTEVYDHPGTFDDYLFHLRESRSGLFDDEAKGRSAAPAPDKAARMAARKQAKAREAELRRLRKALEQAEVQVDRLEARKGELEAALADPAVHADRERSQRLSDEYAQAERDLDAAVERWGETEQAVQEAETIHSGDG